MSFYPPKISERFRAPRNTGKAADGNGVGTSATFVCGAVMRFTLLIEKETKKILAAKFQTNGCGYLIAAADVLAERVIGKRLTTLHGLDKSVLRTEIESELGLFGEHRKHCLELSLAGLQAAFADFRARQLEEWSGEKALICTCFGVSEEVIETVIKTNALRTVEDVTEKCSAGSGCGSCQPLIQEILDVTRREENIKGF